MIIGVQASYNNVNVEVYTRLLSASDGQNSSAWKWQMDRDNYATPAGR